MYVHNKSITTQECVIISSVCGGVEVLAVMHTIRIGTTQHGVFVGHMAWAYW